MRGRLAALALVLVAPARSPAPPTAPPAPAASPVSATARQRHSGHAVRAAAAPSPRARGRALPSLQVRRVVTGLDNPWDVKRLPGGTLLVTERDRARLSA